MPASTSTSTSTSASTSTSRMLAFPLIASGTSHRPIATALSTSTFPAILMRRSRSSSSASVALSQPPSSSAPPKRWTKHRKKFNGYWNPERRLLRMTKEHGTLPSLSNSYALRPGGGTAALFSCAALLAVFVSFTRFVGRL